MSLRLALLVACHEVGLIINRPVILNQQAWRARWMSAMRVQCEARSLVGFFYEVQEESDISIEPLVEVLMICRLKQTRSDRF